MTSVILALVFAPYAPALEPKSVAPAPIVAAAMAAPVALGERPCPDLLTAPPAPAQVYTPAEIFQRSREMIVKLDTRLRGSHAEAAHGTAFVVGRDGRLATNYHVVASHIAESSKYELVAILPTGETPAKVIAIDPVNDIAVVKIAKTFPNELSAETGALPAVGDPLYSVGFPKSEEITLTSGNFNGEHRMGFAPVMKLSMPLNPGMSGGPCFDRFGSVVGINRALQVGAQNISYLSPNAPLRDLIAKSATVGDADKVDWKSNILKSVLAQESQPLEPGERQHIGKISFTTPMRGTKCGQDKIDSSSTNKQEFMICRGESLALLGTEQSSLEVLTVVARSESLLRRASPFDALAGRYVKAKDAHEPLDGRSLASLAKDHRQAREKCNSRSIRNGADVAMAVRYCSVEVPQFPGLYNTFVKIEVDEGKGATTNIAQSFEGMSLDTTARLLTQFVESVHRE